MFGLSRTQADLRLWADALTLQQHYDQDVHWQLVEADEGVRVETALESSSQVIRVRGQAVLRNSCDRACELLLRLMETEMGLDARMGARLSVMPMGGYRIEVRSVEGSGRSDECLLTPVAPRLTRLVWNRCDQRGSSWSSHEISGLVETCRRSLLTLRQQARQQRQSQ